MWNTTEPDIIAETISYVVHVESAEQPIGYQLPMKVSFVPTKEQPLDVHAWTALLTLDEGIKLVLVLNLPVTGDTHHCEYLFEKTA
jgi:hypothetical protein